MSTVEQPVDRLDVRLVPAALLAWGAVLVGMLAGWQCATVVAAGALVSVPALLRAGRRTVAAGIFACLLITAGFSVATALRVHGVAVHPLTAAAQKGTSMALRVQIADDPRLLNSSIPGAPPQVLVRATLRAADGYRSLHGAVVLLAPAKDWAGLLPGQDVALSGRLTPPQRPDLTVAAVRVSSPPTLLGDPSWVQRAAGALRARLHAASTRVLSAEPGALLPGLVVGDTSSVPQGLTADFRTAGLTHLVAVSGSNAHQAVLLWSL